MLKNQHKANYESNRKLQQIALSKSNIKLSQKKSLKIKAHKSMKQSQTNNIHNLIDSKSETGCNIQIQKENNCKVSKSITTRRSNKDVYTECKNQRTVKSICYLEMKRKKPKKIYHKIKKYKKNYTNKSGKNKYCKKILNKENTNKFSKITVLHSKKNDIKINKDIVKHKNFLDIKNLTIALTKIDDLPLSELSKIIPDYVANKLKKQDNKRIYYETKDIIKTQCCSYKQFRTTELKQNEEINVLYHKSVFEKKCTKFQENIMEEIDTNITNIKFEKNTYKMSLQNEINNIEILRDNEYKLENINLLENILKFFLKTKDNMINRKTRHKSKIQKLHEHGIIKSLAICNKCKEIINLLQQFSNKINFINDEKLCIECTLCNLQINSLSHFQEHVMNIHLKCEKDILPKKNKFAVVIINFNKQLNLNNNNQFIFECCCCSKIFDHMSSFEEHVKKYHNFNYCIKENKETKQIVKNSELYTAFQNESKFKKNHNLNKNHIFDITAKAVEISNLEKKTDTQHNNINEFCINTKEINFKNNMYYNSNNNLLSKIKIKEKQVNDSQIMQKIPKIKDIKKLNIDEKYLNNIAIISDSNSKSLQNQNSNSFNDCFNQKYKGRKYKKTFFITCNICSKKYKRKYMFLSHMSTHLNNSHADVYKKQKIQESKKTIKYENDLILQNVNSIINLEKSNQNISISEIIDKKVNVKNENMEYVITKDNIVNENDDYNCTLNINLTQKTKEGIKKQKLIKFNMNIAKKYTTNTTSKEKFVESIIENKFPINFNTNSNFIMNISKNKDSYNLTELYCNICDKKFNSLTILRKHMFFLHDSLFENSQFPNSLIIPYFNNLHKTKNLFRKENNILSKIKILKRILQKQNKVHEKTIYQIPNKNNIKIRNRKWRCSPCKENFALLRNYLRHKYYCHNDESVIHICDNCNKILTSVAMVNIHVCTNVTSWNCKRCNLNFSNAISLTQHNINTHLETIGPHKCKICKSSFLTLHMLIKHETIHSMNNDSSNNLDNFIDFSASVKDFSSHNVNVVNNVNVNTEFNEKELQLSDNKNIFAMCNDIIFLKKLDKLNEKLSKLNITSNILYNNEKILNCKNCNISCFTILKMKQHLKKWHQWNKCEICNNLYLTYELTKHLISHHIVFDLCYKKNNINIQSIHENIDFQNDIIEILGMKRLLSLYEYERFSNIESKYFNCIICSKQFSNIQYYKIHYLKYHDTICLLCNIEFKYNFEAFEHKTKIHKNVDLYLWVVQILLLAILQLNKYGKTIEEVILKCSESRIY